MSFVESVSKGAVKLAIVPIRFYQRFISPFTGASCRFYPSCSEFAIIALHKHGLFSGLLKSLLRLGKCHPFHPGGYDPVR
jgi:putative membrane protein insertion efficiency factor